MHFPELEDLKTLLENKDELIRFEVLHVVKHQNNEFPIIGIVIGPDDKTLPTFGLFGGVHGLEKIGTHLILSYLKNLFYQLKWDKNLRHKFTEMRLVSIPLINPVGMFHNKRSNGNDVDLMRNAPIDAVGPTSFLLGGQRLSRHLPWFRGDKGSPMEIESQVLCQFVKDEMFESKFSMALDIHSGFGIVDRVWYPYAKTNVPFPSIGKMKQIIKLFNQSFPYHIYKFEGQSASYTTNGDLWDYLYDQHYYGGPNGASGEKTFIPLTLEMGSWSWVKKNPFQLFYSDGLFNPKADHRFRRTMRRHIALIELLARITSSEEEWQKMGQLL